MANFYAQSQLYEQFHGSSYSIRGGKLGSSRSHVIRAEPQFLPRSPLIQAHGSSQRDWKTKKFLKIIDIWEWLTKVAQKAVKPVSGEGRRCVFFHYLGPIGLTICQCDETRPVCLT